MQPLEPFLSRFFSPRLPRHGEERDGFFGRLRALDGIKRTPTDKTSKWQVDSKALFPLLRRPLPRYQQRSRGPGRPSLAQTWRHARRTRPLQRPPQHHRRSRTQIQRVLNNLPPLRAAPSCRATANGRPASWLHSPCVFVRWTQNPAVRARFPSPAVHHRPVRQETLSG